MLPLCHFVIWWVAGQRWRYDPATGHILCYDGRVLQADVRFTDSPDAAVAGAPVICAERRDTQTGRPSNQSWDYVNGLIVSRLAKGRVGLKLDENTLQLVLAAVEGASLQNAVVGIGHDLPYPMRWQIDPVCDVMWPAVCRLPFAVCSGAEAGRGRWVALDLCCVVCCVVEGGHRG